MARWFEAFVQHERKVSLGLTGATVADLAALNPEALAVIDAHPDIFEIVLRPFAHDIALLRSRAGFTTNVALGRRALARFANVTPYFLPPEFMLTNDQVRLLEDAEVEGVFINASRFKSAVAARIPHTPYRIHGVLGASLLSIPLEGDLTQAYLSSLHRGDATPWNAALARGTTRLSWRDGESWLFLPDGLARETAWLAGEIHTKRVFLREAFDASAVRREAATLAYPVHSFSEWVREFRMLGYLYKVRDVEGSVETFNAEQLALWLQLINSDVLSAVEKDDPRIKIEVAGATQQLVIPRSDRGYEGEDFLVIFEGLETTRVLRYLDSDRPHLKKLRARLAFIQTASK
jgi:hypothetical protein